MDERFATRVEADPAMPASPDNAASYKGTNASGTNRLPLCVDLDGTLIKSDTLLDALCTVARVQPSALLRLPGWLLRGKAAVKYELLTRAHLDAAQLPYNESLVVYLREQAALGRPLYLTTGADQSLAIHVAQHLGIFTGVLASDGATNLTGSRKLERIRSEFAGEAFAYVGNSRADLPLLQAAAQPMLANPTLPLAATLPAQRLAIARVFRDRAPLRKTLRRTIRAHQWAKNVLIFLPLLLAHNLGPAKLLAALIAFFSFSLTASSTYILNDLLDLSSDRAHPTKRRRPLAAGDMPVLAAMALGLALFAAGIALALLLPASFLGWLLVYCVVTLAYSLYCKRVVIVDVIILSALYALRILAGAAATGVPVSDWMAGFAIFFFFSLALVKRFSELENLRARGATQSSGRGYMVHDMEQLRAFGTSSAFASIIVFALYINNPEVRLLYHHAGRLWLMTPLLIGWLSRIWLRASRGQMNEDPVIFALTDPASLLVGVAMFLVALSAAI